MEIVDWITTEAGLRYRTINSSSMSRDADRADRMSRGLARSNTNESRETQHDLSVRPVVESGARQRLYLAMSSARASTWPSMTRSRSA